MMRQSPSAGEFNLTPPAMARSLPLGPSVAAPIPGSQGDETPVAVGVNAPTLTGSVLVYDPALCCSTGICGPGVDPALLQLARDLRWLASRGATVVRYGLSQEPQAFVANPRVAGLMQAFGDGALPAVLVNDLVLAHGRYPARQELVAALTPLPAVSPTPDVERDAPAGSGCGCTPGSTCS